MAVKWPNFIYPLFILLSIIFPSLDFLQKLAAVAEVPVSSSSSRFYNSHPEYGMTTVPWPNKPLPVAALNPRSFGGPPPIFAPFKSLAPPNSARRLETRNSLMDQQKPFASKLSRAKSILALQWGRGKQRLWQKLNPRRFLPRTLNPPPNHQLSYGPLLTTAGTYPNQNYQFSKKASENYGLKLENCHLNGSIARQPINSYLRYNYSTNSVGTGRGFGDRVKSHSVWGTRSNNMVNNYPTRTMFASRTSTKNVEPVAASTKVVSLEIEPPQYDDDNYYYDYDDDVPRVNEPAGKSPLGQLLSLMPRSKSGGSNRPQSELDLDQEPNLQGSATFFPFRRRRRRRGRGRGRGWLRGWGRRRKKRRGRRRGRKRGPPPPPVVYQHVSKGQQGYTFGGEEFDDLGHHESIPIKVEYADKGDYRSTKPHYTVRVLYEDEEKGGVIDKLTTPHANSNNGHSRPNNNGNNYDNNYHGPSNSYQNGGFQQGRFPNFPAKFQNGFNFRDGSFNTYTGQNWHEEFPSAYSNIKSNKIQNFFQGDDKFELDRWNNNNYYDRHQAQKPTSIYDKLPPAQNNRFNELEEQQPFGDYDEDPLSPFPATPSMKTLFPPRPPPPPGMRPPGPPPPPPFNFPESPPPSMRGENGPFPPDQWRPEQSRNWPAIATGIQERIRSRKFPPFMKPRPPISIRNKGVPHHHVPMGRIRQDEREITGMTPNVHYRGQFHPHETPGQLPRMIPTQSTRPSLYPHDNPKYVPRNRPQENFDTPGVNPNARTDMEQGEVNPTAITVTVTPVTGGSQPTTRRKTNADWFLLQVSKRGAGGGEGGLDEASSSSNIVPQILPSPSATPTSSNREGKGMWTSKSSTNGSIVRKGSEEFAKTRHSPANNVVHENSWETGKQLHGRRKQQKLHAIQHAQFGKRTMDLEDGEKTGNHSVEAESPYASKVSSYTHSGLRDERNLTLSERRAVTLKRRFEKRLLESEGRKRYYSREINPYEYAVGMGYTKENPLNSEKQESSETQEKILGRGNKDAGEELKKADDFDKIAGERKSPGRIVWNRWSRLVNITKNG